MNMAVHALIGGDVTAALVGGVSLLQSEGEFRLFKERGLLPRTSQFHLFDRRSSGAILGEGAGVVLLKTLDQARRDGDVIYAIVNSIAVNNDGRTSGPTAPSLQAQKDVMIAALAKSGRPASQIDYVCVNGSGSEITDLLELKAIESVYRSDSQSPCLLGSVKPNIGHPLCAEGIASLIKVVLMLHHKHWVPFLSGDQPMRHYDFNRSPFKFCRTSTRCEYPAVAAINCFGDGGTNAHVILQSADGLNASTRRSLPSPAWDRKDFGKRLTEHPEQVARVSEMSREAALDDLRNDQCFWETFAV
jgi:acyl transferase domain-containing protein